MGSKGISFTSPFHGKTSLGKYRLFDLILYDPSTIFQLYRDGPSWVTPELSSDTGEARTRGPSKALYHSATALPKVQFVPM